MGKKLADAKRDFATGTNETNYFAWKQARNLCRDIRDAYAGESGDLGKLVDEARTLADKKK